MRIDGKYIASDILAGLQAQLVSFKRVPRVCVVTIDPTPATESYLRIKTKRALEAGMELYVLRFDSSVGEEKIIQDMLAAQSDAIVVQLPLPDQFDTQKILSAIPIEKDADVLSDEAYGCFEKDIAGALLPPVVGAIEEICERSVISISGKKIVIVGNGKLVGKPAQIFCERKNGMVSVVTRETPNSAELLKEAEIIISGAGSPRFILPEMINQGVVLIDAGTSESGGAIVGDADPRCEEKCSLFTPVPGGVGPIAVACLFKNVAELL